MRELIHYSTTDISLISRWSIIWSKHICSDNVLYFYNDGYRVDIECDMGLSGSQMNDLMNGSMSAMHVVLLNIQKQRITL